MSLGSPLRVVQFFFGDLSLFLRYISIGACSALVELVFFSLAYQFWGWPLLLANSSALALAMMVNFAGQKRWTFRMQGELPRQLRFYLLMQAISALVNNLLIYLMIALWDWFPPLAKVIQIGLVFVWNFSFCKLVVFARQPPASGQPDRS